MPEPVLQLAESRARPETGKTFEVEHIEAGKATNRPAAPRSAPTRAQADLFVVLGGGRHALYRRGDPIAPEHVALPQVEAVAQGGVLAPGTNPPVAASTEKTPVDDI